MSCLRLYSPRHFSLYAPWEPEVVREEESTEDAPRLLRFPTLRSAASQEGNPRALLQRTRVIHDNRCCPACGRATALPVDQQPHNTHDHMPVPGAGTLVGFQCLRCDHEWAISEDR